MSDISQKNRRVVGRILFGISATWVQSIVAVLTNLVQIPLFYRYLARDTLGAWMIFASLGLFLLLWDMGLGVTFARSMAYFRGTRESGSTIALKPPATPAESPQDMIKTVSLTYWILAAALYTMGLAAGRIYLGQLEFDTTPFGTVWLAWIIYSFGCAVNLGAITPFHCLSGVGDVGIEQSLQTVCNLVALLANIIILVAGGGIVELSLVFVARGFAARAAAWFILKRRHPWLFAQKGRFSRSCLRAIRGDCVRIFITRLGAFLILQTPGLVIAQFLTPKRVPDFMAMWMIMQLGMIGGTAIGQAVTPFAATAYATGDGERILRLHRNAASASLFLLGLWSVGFIVWGQQVFALWIGPGHFLGYSVLLPMLITGTLEVHHSINSNFVWSSGQWPFAPWAIAAGILNLGLGIWWVHVAGEAGMAWATCIAQLATNNWFGVYYALRVLRVSLREYALRVVSPVAVIVAVSAVAAVGIKEGLLNSVNLAGKFRGVPATEVLALVAGSLVVVTFAAALFWRFGMDAEGRRALRFHLQRLAMRGV